MSVIRKLLLQRFWDDWRDRFLSESDIYITPYSSGVQKAVSSLNISSSDDDVTKAVRAWGYVHKNVDYVLSKRWKTPDETLEEGIADCEDYTFLLASMFEAMGLENHQIRVGDIKLPDGRTEQHTWNIVNGRIVDGTGEPNDVEHIQYKTVFEFNMVTECETC